MAYVFPSLSYHDGSFLLSHYIDTLIPFYDSISSTVFYYSFLIFGSCSHYLGGMIHLYDNNIATVLPYSSYNSGLCYQIDYGVIPF